MISHKRISRALTVAAVVAGAAVTVGQTTSIETLLSEYQLGQYAVASIVAATPNGFLQFRREFEQRAPLWIGARGPAAEVDRRHVVSAFVLEFVRANETQWNEPSFDDQTRVGLFWARGPAQMDEGVRASVQNPIPQMVEWTWQLLQAESPADFARTWAFAAIAQLEYDGDRPYLYGPKEIPADKRPQEEARIGVPLGLLGRVRARFPDDPRFALRAALADPQYEYPFYQELAFRIRQRREVRHDRAAEIIRRGAALETQIQNGAADLELGVADRRLAEESKNLSDLDSVAGNLEPLRQNLTVRADADLDLGMIAMCFAEHDQARQRFEEVLQSQPLPCQGYHAFFLRGQLDEEDQRLDDAEQDYEHALQVEPGAQSAATSLASLLWLHDRPSEAAALIERQSAAPLQVDPWDWVLGAPCSHWPEAIAAVRARLR